jgi:Holliday junction resolvasome RuvABC endonuclease subunit
MEKAKQIIIGIDPGLTVGWAEIHGSGSGEVEIKSGQLTSAIPECRDDKIYMPIRRALPQICNRLRGLLVHGTEKIQIAIEGVVLYSDSIIGKSTIFTAADIGYIFSWATRHDIQCHWISKPDHNRAVVGPGCTRKGTQAEKNRRLRIALENLYGEEKIKQANCRNDHKRNALSVATALAMRLGIVKW